MRAPRGVQVVRDELQDGRSHGVGLLVGRNCDRQDEGKPLQRRRGWPPLQHHFGSQASFLLPRLFFSSCVLQELGAKACRT